MRTALVLALGLGLVFSACGSDDGDRTASASGLDSEARQACKSFTETYAAFLDGTVGGFDKMSAEIRRIYGVAQTSDTATIREASALLNGVLAGENSGEFIAAAKNMLRACGVSS